MNPLFKNATRAIKDAMRAEFRSGETGRALRELERKTLKKGQAKKYLNQIARKIHGGLPLPGWKHERVSEKLERYARESGEKRVMDIVFKAMGPLGDILKAMVRPRGKKMASVDRELSAAQNLLQAFGYEVIPPPPKRAGLKGKEAAAKAYMEALGWQVQKPKPLPGWTAARTAQAGQAIETPYRPSGARKTVDLDLGAGRLNRIPAGDPLLTGKMIPVVSTNVHSIGFDISPHNPAIGTLKVRFLQSHGQSKVAGAVYEYYHVPTEVFQKFRRAASKGKFVWDKLRIRGTVSGHQFDYKLTGISRGYVPRKATYTPQGEYFTPRTFLGENTRTGEKRLFRSQPGAFSRGEPNRGEPNRGRPNRGRS